MPKPEIYGETIFIRVPKGTKDQIDKLREENESFSDAVRRILLVGIARETKRKAQRG